MNTPLIDALRDHQARSRRSFHTPGHKSGQILPPPLLPWADLFTYDLTEVGDLDDLANAQGVLKASQESGAKALGAGSLRYLVGGSSLGLQALILGLCTRKQVFVPTNAHRSILHALILADAHPIFLSPSQDPESGRPLDLSPEVLERACRDHPHCRHLIFVSPTYHGDCCHTEDLVAFAKARGLTLLCDAAHGAHFPFHRDLPADPLALACDACVFSGHKSLPVPTQGAYLAIQNPDLLGPVTRALHLLQTSSPSYLLLASLEAGLAMMASQGHDLISQGLKKVYAFRESLQPFQAIHFAKDYGPSDPFKVYLQTTLGSPQLLSDFLTHRGLYMEMTDQGGVLAMVALDGSGLDDLSQALADYTTQDLLPWQPSFADPLFKPEAQEKPLHQAFFGPYDHLPLKLAEGHLAAQVLTLTPPGTALVLPGMRIGQDHIDSLIHHGLDPESMVAVHLETSLEHDKLKG